MSQGSRQHALICYDERSIEAIKLFASHVTYIKHDKDTNADNTPKKTHYHVICYTDNQKTSSAFYKCYRSAMIRLLNDKEYFDRDEHDNIQAQYVRDVDGIMDYLTHEDLADKYHYSADEIQGDFAWWQENLEELKKALTEDKEDWTITLLSLAIEQGGIVRQDQLADVLKRVGRDALFNLSRVLDNIRLVVPLQIVSKNAVIDKETGEVFENYVKVN